MPKDIVGSQIPGIGPIVTGGEVRTVTADINVPNSPWRAQNSLSVVDGERARWLWVQLPQSGRRPLRDASSARISSTRDDDDSLFRYQ